MRLWNKNQEKLFFINSSKVAFPSQLFHKADDGRYLAYLPKGYKGRKSTLQSRNLLIDEFTENWVFELFKRLIVSDDLFLVRQARIPSLGITSLSPADLVISTSNKKILKASDVKIIFEVEMSIVWNWQYFKDSHKIVEIGDFMTHQGRPSFTCSDSILKAIGKCIGIRVSSYESSKIPIIVIGNAPLFNGFCKKIDHLKRVGMIQGFWSLNPFPLNHGNTRKTTPYEGYIRFNNTLELKKHLNNLFLKDLNFFSGMENSETLGKYIEIANSGNSHEDKGLKFLNLIRHH